jgi:hypothetical protein
MGLCNSSEATKEPTSQDAPQKRPTEHAKVEQQQQTPIKSAITEQQAAAPVEKQETVQPNSSRSSANRSVARKHREGWMQAVCKRKRGVDFAAHIPFPFPAT